MRFGATVVAAWLAFAVPGASTVWAQGASVKEATEEQRARASEEFKRGKGLYDEGKYQEALDAFKSSYGIVESPNTRLSIALSLIGLGRLGDAKQELTETVVLVK